MMNCGMHLGHGKSKLHVSMTKYILGEREGIHVIDLEKTLSCLRQACDVVTDIASRKGKVLFVGTRSDIQRITYEAATFCNQFYVNKRWLGGTITNSKNVLRESPSLSPDLIVIFDLNNNRTAVNEAWTAGIPTVAICDTNIDAARITYPIPANDDSLPGIELVAKTLAMAAKKGSEKWVK